jgi:uncharacterized protein (DUF2252 family)
MCAFRYERQQARNATMSSFEDRQANLAQTRNLKMAESAHRYVRGSTIKFYERLDGASAKIPAGPAVWICGDCHIGNLGPLADAKGRVAIQIRDLDQTVIGNPVHDLIRLGLSLASAARGSDLPGVRQLDKSKRQEWLADLSKNHTKSLEAPSWLWSSVVELLSVHEVAYLEYCRRFAFALVA